MVEIFDSTFSDRDELYSILQKKTGGIIGLYTNLMTRPSIVKIIKQAKANNWTVITGGPESASYVEEYLQCGADYVVLGEGEQTITELMTALKNIKNDRNESIEFECTGNLAL